jgi:ribosomal protein L37AE/L43A
MSKNTIICPHCKKEATVTVNYHGVLFFQAPLIFNDGDWEVDYGNTARDSMMAENPKPDSFSCDECKRKIKNNQLNECWKAREKADKPKSRNK